MTPLSLDAQGPLLEVDGLSTWFPTRRGIVHAVDDVSFALRQQETLGVVGESGSGKSVLARTIMNLTPRSAYTTGSVTFLGRDLLHVDPKVERHVWGNEISMVFQDPARSLNPVMKVGRQIAEALRLHLGQDKKDARLRAIELLDQVGIPEPARHLSSYPHQLSGGMRQRVSIAIAIACGPKLLFADEPTTALDVTIQRQILDLLSSLQQDRGMAMVLISHDFGVVARRTRRIMVLYGGKVIETGPTTALFEDTKHPYTASLMSSIPRLEHESHTPRAVIPGQPVDVVDPKPGCRFAPRCRYAQPRCCVEDPPLVDAQEAGHRYACFYPLGSTEGEAALKANVTAGRNAAGLTLTNGAAVN
jgi:oligopeptide/dipeptide ABC transporter ATP-binding protein